MRVRCLAYRVLKKDVDNMAKYSNKKVLYREYMGYPIAVIVPQNVSDNIYIFSVSVQNNLYNPMDYMQRNRFITKNLMTSEVSHDFTVVVEVYTLD